MAVMPVRRLLLNMAWPMMLSMLIEALIIWWTACSWPSSAPMGSLALALVYPIQT